MSADRELRTALRDVRVPGEAGAEERSWEVVSAAYAERSVIRPTYRARRVAIAVALAALLLALALTPAGAKVGDLVSDVIGVGEENAKPELRSLPAAGELLVESEEGVWVVQDDGSKRLLGEYEDAAWSPNGFYVAAGDGRELVALEPDGTVRWTYPAPGKVRDPRWAGTEIDTRIAYRSGDDLRVIAGDGSPSTDRLIARDVAPVAPAWRPVLDSKLDPSLKSGPYALTYVDANHDVRTVDAEAGRFLPTTTRDMERLSTPPNGGTARRALSPDGTALATLEHVGRRDVLTISSDGGRTAEIFSVRGALSGPTWSPDDRWLLVGWPAADQWLFIEVNRPHRVVAFDRISEQFDPGGTGAGAFPGASGWVLPPG